MPCETGRATRSPENEPAVGRARADEALHVFVIYTIGSAAFAKRSPLGPDASSPSDDAFQAERFERGLGWILTEIGLSPDPARST